MHRATGHLTKPLDSLQEAPFMLEQVGKKQTVRWKSGEKKGGRGELNS